jgi:hypothetical protein
MKCPHLTKWLIFTCSAKEKPYFPSDFQLKEYCKGKDHRKCPFFRYDFTDENVEVAIVCHRT